MNILHVVRALDVGGVTTYVYRLTGALAARGHRVTILAQEGSWGKAPPAGVEWEQCRWPVDERAIAWVASRNFDLVNTHNYGPSSRFGALLSHRLRLPYIMTVHGPRHLLQRLLFRAWSRRVLVVSAADRANITEFGGISRSRVETGFIGMDTERFRPGLDTSSVAAEFGLCPGAPVVTHISRFDTSKIPVTLAVLKAIPVLCDRMPGLTALLIGNGARLGEIKTLADEVNAKMQRRAVLVRPVRYDIPEISNLSSAAIGTATTALETMACGVPTIAAGRTGYFGIVTPENFERGHAICFGDHGRSPASIVPETIVCDVLSVLEQAEEARGAAMKNRDIIAARYNIARMADQIEQVYMKLVSE